MLNVLCNSYRCHLGYSYVGQTGCCLNEHLSEHSYNVKNLAGGFLAMHCKECGFVPLFHTCRIVRQNSSDQLTRKVEEIEKMAKMCVSRPSIALTKGEFDYLGVSTILNRVKFGDLRLVCTGCSRLGVCISTVGFAEIKFVGTSACVCVFFVPLSSVSSVRYYFSSRCYTNLSKLPLCRQQKNTGAELLGLPTIS